MEFFRKLFGLRHEHIWQQNEIYESSAYDFRGKRYKYHRRCIECGKEQFMVANYQMFDWVNKEDTVVDGLTTSEKRHLNLNKLLE